MMDRIVAGERPDVVSQVVVTPSRDNASSFEADPMRGSADVSVTESRSGVVDAAAGQGAVRWGDARHRIRRRHLPELHDQAWWPFCFREFLMRVLVLVWGFPWIGVRRPSAVDRRVGSTPTAPWIPSQAALAADVLKTVLPNRKGAASRVVDLCSGAGGPWAAMMPLLRKHSVDVTLTDLYPTDFVGECVPGIRMHALPVDATMVPSELTGTRTMIGCLHHFQPTMVRRIFQDCVDQRASVVVIESCQRSLGQLIGAGVLMSLLSLVVPIVFFRQTPWRVIFLTYLVPVMPMVVAFDGMVSCARAYTPDEMIAMSVDLENANSYRWRSGTRTFLGLFGLTYLVGQSTDSNEFD